MRRTPRLLAALVPLALLAAACGGGDDDEAQDTTTTSAGASTTVETTGPAPTTTVEPTTTTLPEQEVTIRPLFVRGDTGGAGTEVIRIEPNPETLRVELSETEVAGIGDQSRAASWNAVTVANLLTGGDLNGTYNFQISGFIDGPSAGALKTVAILSLLEGTELAEGMTMTGTVNPDGTVGPVGGIPEKIKGAADEGLTRILIPVGQRNSLSAATGELVDVVELGNRLGVDVSEVRDVYEAYEAFTGEPLSRLPQASNPALDDTAYSRLKAKADSFLAKFQERVGAFNALLPEIQAELEPLATQANEAAQQAANLSTQGLQAGAFDKASEAALVADAAVATGEALQVLLTQGQDAFFSRISGAQAIESQVMSLLDTLKTFNPTTVSDAAGLMAAYANAFDALAIATFASNQIATIQDAVNNGAMTIDEALPELFLPLVYYELAGGVVELAQAIFEVGRDLGGPTIEADVDLAQVADFFRKGSDANFAAFQSNVVKSYANEYGVSEDQMLGRFSNVDTEVALAVAERNILEGLKDYIGPGEPNAEYAQLGFAVSNYARNASLVEKYYSNGQLDDELNIVGARYEAALQAGLDLAKSQVASSVKVLRDQGVEPSIVVGAFESASVSREGDYSDKFSALQGYWSAYLMSRVLSYLGGFPTEGLN